jgi:hypothetical protein
MLKVNNISNHTTGDRSIGYETMLFQSQMLFVTKWGEDFYGELERTRQ